MELIANVLLVAGALSTAIYCIVLARRVRRLTDLEDGVGGAIAALSNQVDDMTKTLTSAQKTSAGSVASLAELTVRAESVARRLELLVASMHDLPDASEQSASTAPEAAGPADSTMRAHPEGEEREKPESANNAIRAFFLTSRKAGAETTQ